MSRNFASLCLLVAVVVTSCLVADVQSQNNIVEISRKTIFSIAVLRSRKPVVVFYYSTSECGACNWSLLPMLEKMVKRKPEILFAKVDLDKVPELREQHGIESIPTTMIYLKGDVEDLVEGSSWGPIVALVNKAAKLQ